jgi:DNA polymerase III delta prime subunit
MDRLWSWLVLDEDQPRLFLYGPGGSGKSTLAYEFARSVAYSSANTKSASGFKIDFVIYLSGKAMEIEPHSGEVRNFSLQDFSTAEDQFRLILNHSGWKNEDETRGMSKATLLNELKGLLSSFFGLIVLDDIDTLTREEDLGMEDLFKTLVRATPAPRCFTRCATSQRCSVIIRFQYRGWRSPMNIHSSWTHV